MMQEWDLLQWELRSIKKKLEEIGLKPDIKHVAVADIPKDADVVVTNVNLEERAKMSVEGTNIPILTLSNFMDQSEYERIIIEIQRMLGHDVPDVFCEDNIVLNAKYTNKEEAIKACADIFIKGGYTDESYKADMLQRDKEASVYLGNGVALPHGTCKFERNESKTQESVLYRYQKE